MTMTGLSSERIWPGHSLNILKPSCKIKTTLSALDVESRKDQLITFLAMCSLAGAVDGNPVLGAADPLVFQGLIYETSSSRDTFWG